MGPAPAQRNWLLCVCEFERGERLKSKHESVCEIGYISNEYIRTVLRLSERHAHPPFSLSCHSVGRVRRTPLARGVAASDAPPPLSRVDDPEAKTAESTRRRRLLLVDEDEEAGSDG